MYPEIIQSEKELNELLSIPNDKLIEMMKNLKGDIIILGVAGKMGISLATLAKRAIEQAGVQKKVIGVARFSSPESEEELKCAGVDTIKCDLSDPDEVAKLPKVANAIYMAAKKFGTEGQEDLTWVMNTLVPGYVARHFKDSRIVVFSTGCVYPFVRAHDGGCSEDVAPNPVGDYAISCLGREMMFNYAARTWKTPICQYRLNYSIDLRYGVLHDIAVKVLNEEVVDLEAGHFNAIWQGDANAQALLCLEHCSDSVEIMNVTGPEIGNVRETALKFAKLFGKEVKFKGEPGPIYLNDSSKATSLFGYPRVSLDTLIKWQAHWIQSGGRTLGKPTKFEKTDGKY